MDMEATPKLPFSAAILAGGQSRRMGQNKSMLEIEGIPIVKRIANILDELFVKVFLVANEKTGYERLGLAVTADIYPGNDSLGGLHTAVARSETSHVFVVGCDMPLLRPRLIVGLASMADDWDVIVPLRNNYPEPLCALYAKRCATPIAESISRGVLKMIGFHSDVRVKRVAEATWRPWDLDGTSFLNANTPEEFEKIKATCAAGEAI